MHDHTSSYLLFNDTSGSADALFRHIDAALAGGAKSLLLLACAANGFTPAALNARLRSLPVPVFGGIFPQLIANRLLMTRGSIVYGLPTVTTIRHIPDISAEDRDFTEAVDAFAAAIAPGSTLLALFDSAGKRMSSCLASLYEVLGDNCRYLGGGAGSPLTGITPCLFSNAGLLQDCVQIAALGYTLNISSGHGWQKFAGPFLVTGAYHNVITTLDYCPAFEVYRKVVETDSGISHQSRRFAELVHTYPLGLEKLDGELSVRSPLLQSGNDLVCVGEVPLNHMLYILKGRQANILATARACVQAATAMGVGKHPALLFDSISRPVLLGEQFATELTIVRAALPPDIPLLGVLSHGQIANNGETCLEMDNKTIAVGVVPNQGDAA
ncbi:MAG: FIST C-terminal domain-containing protein [Candidatus Thiothrix moscowensis]|nr:FIST C-terminal domain-containing protein [Candidatus Thiothrix moscowensis]